MSWFGPQQGGRRGLWRTSPSLFCSAVPPSARQHGNADQLSTPCRVFLVYSQTGKNSPDNCVLTVHRGCSGRGRDLCFRGEDGISVLSRDSEVEILWKFIVLSDLDAKYGLKICPCPHRQLLAQNEPQCYTCVSQGLMSKHMAIKIQHKNIKIFVLLTPSLASGKGSGLVFVALACCTQKIEVRLFHGFTASCSVCRSSLFASMWRLAAWLAIFVLCGVCVFSLFPL